jgi:hypothetical protein
VVSIETAFAINAVESAYLTIGRKEVDAERNAETATVNRPENGGRIDNGAHIGCKDSKKVKK